MVEFIWVTVLGIGIGAVLRYLLPGRDSYGIALLPAAGGITAAAAWSAATWAGWRADAPWAWLLALGGAALICVAVALASARTRRRSDARRLHHLSGGRA